MGKKRKHNNNNNLLTFSLSDQLLHEVSHESYNIVKHGPPPKAKSTTRTLWSVLKGLSEKHSNKKVRSEIGHSETEEAFKYKKLSDS